MHAYLISGKNAQQIEDKINEITQSSGKRIIEYELVKIEDVRNLEKFVKLSVTEPTTILIRNADNASLPAANAFLKSLEEPQSGISFILVANNIYNILPTIVSRCEVVKLTKVNNVEDIDNEKINEFLNSNANEKLSLVDKYKKREDAISLLQDLTAVCHKDLISQDAVVYAKYLKAAQSALNAIKKNANVALQLTVLVIRLEKAKTNSLNKET